MIDFCKLLSKSALNIAIQLFGLKAIKHLVIAHICGAYEMIMQLRKGKSVPINTLGESNIICDVPNKIGNRRHPVEKPVELFSRFILQSSKENEIVLDPFVGAGSCALSCIKNNRKFIGIEIDKKYYDRMVERIKEII